MRPFLRSVIAGAALTTTTLITAAPASAAVTMPSSSSVTAAAYTGEITAQERAIFSDINTYRAEHNVPPILWENSFHAEAVEWGQAMVDGGFFVHDADALRFENLFYSARDPLGATEAWIDSPGHNAILLDPELRVGAIGVVAGHRPHYGDGYFVVLRGYY